MKKRIMTLACVLFAFGAMAQESPKIEFGVSTGVTHYFNNPAMSVFEATEGEYLTAPINLHVGLLDNQGTMYGLRFGLTQASLPNFGKERADIYDLSLIGRRYLPVAGKLESVLGMNLGVSFLNNSFDWAGNNYSRSRVGLFLNFELGLVFRFSNSTYLGLVGSVTPVGSALDKDLDLSTFPYAETSRKMLNNCSLMLNFGFTF
ncbi:MAG: hypothetical protein IJ760_01555 [Bacteroidales bacterium]|nr:hypothetical protein [Bacteroidales bacterium]